ncbi:MAG: 2-oxo acid dehydrogenase subunit E2 [Halodesulfurarchaeum sp.]
MGYVVKMPQMGMSMEQGTVVEWRVEPDETVPEAEVIAIVESEKTQSEITARESGTLGTVLVQEGEAVAPGDPIGVLLGPEETMDDYDVSPPTILESAVEGSAADSTGASDTPAERDGEDDDTPAPPTDEDVKATPGARKLAEERGIELRTVEGSGPQGVVTESDVEEAEVEPARTETGVASQTVTRTESLSGIQATISDRLGQSDREAVHVTLNRSFDTDAIESVRAKAKAVGASLAITDLVIAALSETLAEYPAFNAHFVEGDHRFVEEHNVGVAVDVDAGLLTPVIRDVRGLSVEAINDRRRSVTERVRSGEYSPDDLEGGTFTISNLGHFGVDTFDPVIDPPQIAILGIGRLRPDNTMSLSLSFDHRVVNGADAARFLASLVDRLTDRSRLASYLDADVEEDAIDRRRLVRLDAEGPYSGTYRSAGGSARYDEPEAAGGTDEAPAPVEHLLGALGACLAVSLETMADREDVVIDDLDASLIADPEHGTIDEITVELTIETEETDDGVIDSIVRRAERACYVSRALSDEVGPSVTWTRPP